MNVHPWKILIFDPLYVQAYVIFLMLKIISVHNSRLFGTILKFKFSVFVRNILKIHKTFGIHLKKLNFELFEPRQNFSH